MLVLSRKQQQTIVIDGQIQVTILGIQGNTVRIGIEAPKEVPIIRQELVCPTTVVFPSNHATAAQAAG